MCSAIVRAKRFKASTLRSSRSRRPSIPNTRWHALNTAGRPTQSCCQDRLKSCRLPMKPQDQSEASTFKLKNFFMRQPKNCLKKSALFLGDFIYSLLSSTGQCNACPFFPPGISFFIYLKFAELKSHIHNFFEHKFIKKKTTY